MDVKSKHRHEYNKCQVALYETGSAVKNIFALVEARPLPVSSSLFVFGP